MTIFLRFNSEAQAIAEMPQWRGEREVTEERPTGEVVQRWIYSYLADDERTEFVSPHELNDVQMQIAAEKDWCGGITDDVSDVRFERYEEQPEMRHIVVGTEPCWIAATHSHRLQVVERVMRDTGRTQTVTGPEGGAFEASVMEPVPGFHVNLLTIGCNLPANLETYRVSPEFPSVIFG